MVYAKLFLTALFWGGTFIAGRHVSQHLDPFTIAFLRFAMASVLLVTLAFWQEGGLPRLTGGQFVWSPCWAPPASSPTTSSSSRAST